MISNAPSSVFWPLGLSTVNWEHRGEQCEVRCRDTDSRSRQAVLCYSVIYTFEHQHRLHKVLTLPSALLRFPGDHHTLTQQHSCMHPPPLHNYPLSHMEHDGPVVLDLLEQVLGVDQLGQDPGCLLHHVQPFCFSLDLDKVPGDGWHTTRFLARCNKLVKEVKTLFGTLLQIVIEGQDGCPIGKISHSGLHCIFAGVLSPILILVTPLAVVLATTTDERTSQVRQWMEHACTSKPTTVLTGGRSLNSSNWSPSTSSFGDEGVSLSLPFLFFPFSLKWHRSHSKTTQGHHTTLLLPLTSCPLSPQGKCQAGSSACRSPACASCPASVSSHTPGTASWWHSCHISTGGKRFYIHTELTSLHQEAPHRRKALWQPTHLLPLEWVIKATFTSGAKPTKLSTANTSSLQNGTLTEHTSTTLSPWVGQWSWRWHMPPKRNDTTWRPPQPKATTTATPEALLSTTHQDRLRIVTLWTEHKLPDEPIQQLLQLDSLMRPVDNVAACLVQLGLGTQFKSKIFARIWAELQGKQRRSGGKQENVKYHTRYH